MKILWITNTIFPELSKKMGNETAVVGGWMYGLANDLVNKGVELIVVTARPNIKSYNADVNGIKYFLLSGRKKVTDYDVFLEKQWQDIIEHTNPDLIHIHGTEYALGLSLMKTFPNLKYVISIQGLVSVCSRYFKAGISSNKIKKHKTLRDILRKDGILNSQRSFFNRGELVEKQYFKMGTHFIGRTNWDYAHTMTLNPSAKYHFCNESLRDSFYKAKKWHVESMHKQTIFLSQAIYPLKGLHKVIEAVALIKDDFPGLKIRIAGGDITKTETLKDKMAIGGYGNYINSLIRRFTLYNQIEFVGLLDEKQMINEYLNCNVFICPSSIENSPNSLGEAQLLGVPCIGSYVGGIPDMIDQGETGILYRFDEVEMMAQGIKKIFGDSVFAQKLSLGGILVASKRHDRITNLNQTLKIYQSL